VIGADQYRTRALTHTAAAAAAAAAAVDIRHKKKPEWWATLEPSLHALGRDFQVRGAANWGKRGWV
jgi:hypothetical protein